MIKGITFNIFCNIATCRLSRFSREKYYKPLIKDVDN